MEEKIVLRILVLIILFSLRDICLAEPVLRIFVSSSMPKPLLKSYAAEAHKYGGVLVFRGLPDGSMKKLTDLAMELSADNTAGMQIDDEAFANFEVTQVPTIALSEPEGAKFDKVAGSITVKAALELFANDGDMRGDARRLLE